MKLKVTALGLAVGITWALGLILVGIIAMTTRYYGDAVTWIGTLYIGYEATVVGIIVGALWAFVDGFIAAAIMAWLYNRFVK